MRKIVEELFHEVADLSRANRARFLAIHKIDSKTQKEVEALVAFDSGDSLALDEEIGQVAHRALARFEPKDLRCGPYRLGQILGNGGMGTVYLAERADGEVTQRVAVKILRPGVDNPRLRQLFLVERQILAGLSHPNIARLLDAGHQEDGQPYLVMEVVDGTAIDTYTVGHTILHKVMLYLKVCAAVGYLHRNLVVHRDLKPANILVTADGEPKLLDFGIAKMIDLTADSAVTAMRMLTPDYASPEQVTGGPVTTAADVYSLGAVLYKLLTGASPHQYDGEAEGTGTSSIATGKITPPSKLVPALRGDLEFVLLKALRRDPRERYVTVEQLAEDLESYLESRPIRARRGDVWYRTRKFLSRHWLPVAATTLAIAGLATGFAVATQERAMAQRRFLDVRQLANKLFEIDLEARKLAGSTKTRQLIVDTSLEYLRRLSADARADPDLALEVGNAYMCVARVQGVPISQNLGQMGQAEQNLRQAEKFIHTALASEPANRTALLRLAQTAHDRMVLARFNGRSDEALAFARKSAEWLEKFHAGNSDKAEASAILVTYLNVADQHTIGRQFDDAVRLCRRGSDLARSFNSQLYLGNFLWVSGEVFRQQGDLDEALKQTRESARVLELGSGNTKPGPTMNLILALTHQGRILGEDHAISLGRPEEAAGVLERAFKIADTFVHEDPNDQMARGRLALAGLSLADILRHSDARHALTVYDHILGHLAEFKDNSSFRRYEVSALAGSTYALRRLGRPAEARKRLGRAFERLRQVKSYPAERIKPGSEPDEALCALADYEASYGNVPEAIFVYKELLDRVLAAKPTPETSLSDAVDVSRVYAGLEALYVRAGERDQAVTLRERRRHLWLHWDARLPYNTFVRRQLLGTPKATPSS